MGGGATAIEMPFSPMRRGVGGGKSLEKFGDGGVGRLDRIDLLAGRDHQLRCVRQRAGVASDDVGETEADAGFPCEDGVAGGGAVRRGRVAAGKAHARAGKPGEIGCDVIIALGVRPVFVGLALHGRPPLVIRQKEEEIRTGADVDCDVDRFIPAGGA